VKETHSTASAVVEDVASQPSGGDASLGVATPDARTDAPTKGHTSSEGDTASSQAGSGSISTSQNADDTAATKASKASKQPASAQAAPAPTSTSQESFFKSIHKRLQVLETNATLSLQYIEEQSKILRDAFSKVEKRQLAKTEEFLQHLNNSVRTELKTFRQQYDQLWQSTVIELETHREQYQREIVAVTSRLSIVADELVFQKRMAVVQSTLLLLCLGLVLFVRTGGSALDLPLMQNVLTKSHSMLGLQFDSPVMSPFAKQGRGRSSEQLASGESSRTPSLSPSPSPSPSPKRAAKPHYRSPSIKGADGSGLAGAMADGAAGRGGRRGSRSGPATPTGRRRVRVDREGSMEWGSSVSSGNSNSNSNSNSAAEESPVAASRGNATD
jgi:archaellum component FlaC